MRALSVSSLASSARLKRSLFFFFFQAEDGIRDVAVTGVQTCALPISGRGNVYQIYGRPVVADYGHNAAALAAMGRLMHEAWGGTPVAAVTLPGDRRDDLVAETAAAIADWFGRVVVYEDSDLRGRRPGEMTGLISAALAARRPGITIETAVGPAAALRTALGLASGPGAVLLLHETLAAARDALATLKAVP